MRLSTKPEKNRLITTLGASLILHFAFVAFLSLNPWPTLIKARPHAYTITLMPFPLQEPEIQKPLPPPRQKEEHPKMPEKIKPPDKPKKDEIVEKIKKPISKESLKHLQEALDEIRKKAALDEIQKRVARRERMEDKPPIAPPSTPTFPHPTSRPVPTFKPSSSLFPTQSRDESILNEYYSLIWARIKGAWTIPENLISIREKEIVDLETIIVLIIERDGKIQKSWFEKKSGNDIYDQMAMRAIKKAEPFPPIPKELSENSIEIGIRFFPD